jgi:hypothetical protein
MNHEAAYCLAKTEHGRVTVCACGCTHLMFGRVTLHFETEAAFQEMAETVMDEEHERTPDEEFDLRFDWYSMSLSPYGSSQLAQLLRDATDALAWLRGDLRFTDEDFQKLTS